MLNEDSTTLEGVWGKWREDLDLSSELWSVEQSHLREDQPIQLFNDLHR